jgi:hypothetical protein
LPELIDNIKADPSEHRIHFFHNKIKNLVTEAALMDLRPLLPFFEAVSLLVGVITMDYVGLDQRLGQWLMPETLQVSRAGLYC